MSIQYDKNSFGFEKIHPTYLKTLHLRNQALETVISNQNKNVIRIDILKAIKELLEIDETIEWITMPEFAINTETLLEYTLFLSSHGSIFFIFKVKKSSINSSPQNEIDVSNILVQKIKHFVVVGDTIINVYSKGLSEINNRLLTCIFTYITSNNFTTLVQQTYLRFFESSKYHDNSNNFFINYVSDTITYAVDRFSAMTYLGYTVEHIIKYFTEIFQYSLCKLIHIVNNDLELITDNEFALAIISYQFKKIDHELIELQLETERLRIENQILREQINHLKGIKSGVDISSNPQLKRKIDDV